MQSSAKRAKTEQTPKDGIPHYVAADKGISLDFVLDSEPEVLFFQGRWIQPLTKFRARFLENSMDALIRATNIRDAQEILYGYPSRLRDRNG